MQRKAYAIRAVRAFLFTLSVTLIFSRCSHEQEPEPYKVLELTATDASSCGCNFVVPYSSSGILFDGAQKGVKPGNTICLEGGKTYGTILFRNIRGSSTAPVTIKNCSGTVNITATGKPFGIRTELSSFLRITGTTGSGMAGYGIRVNGGQMSVTLDKQTTNVEVDHVEIYNSGFAGLAAKTDPACDNLGVRGYFTMRDVKIHDNYVHETAGEGLYVGNSYWTYGVNTSCGVKYPHAIENAKIYNNLIRNSGWESIQVGSAPTGTEIYNNRIENYGTKNQSSQNNGIQLGEGTMSKLYGNFIKGGKGHGVIILGNSQQLVHDNVIVNAGIDGIFCDDRTATGPGFTFTNNTIIRPALNGIRLYADQVIMSKIQNNIIIAPGNYYKLAYPRKKEEAYVYLLSSNVKVQVANNYYSLDINSPKFAGASTDNYALTTGSTVVVNKGISISTLGIPVDYAKKTRLIGAVVDIGAHELQ